MDNRFFLVLVVLTVAASGCTTDTGKTGNDIDPVKMEKGLEITELTTSDTELVPNQRATITVTLENYHIKPVEIEQLQLYNLGFLEIVNQKSCTPRQIDVAKMGYIPKMECRWVVKAPPASEMEGFSSKTIPLKLRLKYASQVSNHKQALKLDFKPLKDIKHTSDVKKTYSNGEVEFTVATENPVPFSKTGGGRMLNIKADNAGKGDIASDGYSFSYSPESVFLHGDGSCPTSKKPIIGDKVEFSCRIVPDVESSVTRNLLISVSYKYVKAPTLDIEVVNR